MFIKLLVPYKTFAVGAVVKAESLPADVVKDLLFKGGAKSLGSNSQYTTRVMTPEKVSNKSKSKKVEAETEQDSE